jgi:hypothetical protein
MPRRRLAMGALGKDPIDWRCLAVKGLHLRKSTLRNAGSMQKKPKGFGKPVHQNSSDRYLAQFAKKLAQSPISQSVAGIVMNSTGTVKMSEVLEEFVDPYLDERQSTEEQRKLFTISVFAWNLALEPDETRQLKMDEIIEEMMPNGTERDHADMRLILEGLINRKHDYFKDINRFIANLEIKDLGRNLHLSVASLEVNKSKGKV